jgi:iron(III) transport system substrate-binding protein
MDGLETRLYCCSSDMINVVESGELLVAYNALGN